MNTTRFIRSTAPGFPTRGWRDHAALAPEGDAPAAPATPADQQTEIARLVAAAQAAEVAAKAEVERAQKILDEARKAAAADKPIAASSPASDELQAIKTELAALRKERLVSAVRGMGLQAKSWPDERILALVPDVDPKTAEGRTKLEAWRTANVDLFTAPAGPQTPMVAEMIELAKKATPQEHPIFGHAYMAQTFANVFKDGAL